MSFVAFITLFMLSVTKHTALSKEIKYSSKTDRMALAIFIAVYLTVFPVHHNNVAGF